MQANFPGTGKSFIGALVAKVLHDHTSGTILVQTYTNHALDQYLEDLLNIGIPAESIVRLGTKSTERTKPLSMFEQANTSKMSVNTYNMIRKQEEESESYLDSLTTSIEYFSNMTVSDQALLDYLEFSDDSNFFDAFVVPASQDGMQRVGRRGKSVGHGYLLNQWVKGNDAGIFKDIADVDYPHIWEIKVDDRRAYMSKWMKSMINERVSGITNLLLKYNQCQESLAQLRREKFTNVLSQKRIIGCTTTAAAKYTLELRKAAPSIIIVEEAGEILESHILTAMSASTKQLVLIGDHKQLGPKINNYSLSVEKGEGFNLDQSLFERLVNAGVPHNTLNRQHRMRPEISTYVRSLTYPELEDALTTKKRPQLRGLQDNVIFVSHNHPELNGNSFTRSEDENVKASKENEFEARMVLKLVRYLGQQGYDTDDLVVLTPYLGQLNRLVETLSNEHDPVLNDLDLFQLMHTGLNLPVGTDVSKRKIKISTIGSKLICTVRRSAKFP